MNESLMKHLLKNGADPDSRNFGGKTPQDLLPDTDIGKDVKRRIFFVPRAKWRPKLAPQLLKQSPQCSEEKKTVCKEFFVTVIFYWRQQALSWSQTASVYSVLYRKDTLRKLEDEFVGIIQAAVRSKANKNRNAERPDAGDVEVQRSDVWKWIHLPANNVSDHLPAFAYP